MSEVIIVIIVLTTFVYQYLNNKQRDQAEIKRIREVTLAVKTQSASEYIEALPEEGELPNQDSDDELIEMDQVDPAQLIKGIKNAQQK